MCTFIIPMCVRACVCVCTGMHASAAQLPFVVISALITLSLRDARARPRTPGRPVRVCSAVPCHALACITNDDERAERVCTAHTFVCNVFKRIRTQSHTQPTTHTPLAYGSSGHVNAPRRACDCGGPSNVDAHGTRRSVLHETS